METKNVKRHTFVQNPKLEEALVLWLNEITVHHGVSAISDDILRMKAKEFGIKIVCQRNLNILLDGFKN